MTIATTSSMHNKVLRAGRKMDLALEAYGEICTRLAEAATHEADRAKRGYEPNTKTGHGRTMIPIDELENTLRRCLEAKAVFWALKNAAAVVDGPEIIE